MQPERQNHVPYAFYIFEHFVKTSHKNNETETIRMAKPICIFSISKKRPHSWAFLVPNGLSWFWNLPLQSLLLHMHMHQYNDHFYCKQTSSNECCTGTYYNYGNSCMPCMRTHIYVQCRTLLFTTIQLQKSYITISGFWKEWMNISFEVCKKCNFSVNL